MGNLEHNIKEAFTVHDAKTKLADKGGMWNRLDNQMGRSLGVAALWRVTAVLLGVFLLTGAFAAFNYRAEQHAEIEELEMENVTLVATIDSLLSLPVATKTEIQIIEKEKIVYRDRPILQQNNSSTKNWEAKYQKLADSTELILTSNTLQYERKITQLDEELKQTKEELDKLEHSSDKELKSKKTAPFQLKSERIEVGVDKKPSVRNPELEMKIFQKNFIENRNNLNSTIFKK